MRSEPLVPCVNLQAEKYISQDEIFMYLKRRFIYLPLRDVLYGE